MPDERFRAVQRTQKFLTDILWCKYDEIEEGSPAWDEARRCLKHFPSDYHMEDVAEVSEHFEDVCKEYHKRGKPTRGDNAVPDWPDEERMDIIGQNGNNGEHYD